MIATLIFLLGVAAFVDQRLLSYLRYFQQEEYNHTRFIEWFRSKRAWDTRGSAIVVATCLSSVLLWWWWPATWLQFLLALAAVGALMGVCKGIEGDPRSSGKIRLNMTQRASKIRSVAFLLFCVALVITALALKPNCSSCHTAPSLLPSLGIAAIISLLLVQLPPWLLLGANKLLWPAEKHLQDSFQRDAERILREVNPFVVGITGSYGKTGAKAALGELLQQGLGPTFWPKKSINTVMGITRSIREDLRPFHKYAVMEMGAYGIGSIKRLCSFTPPQAALVTAVGIMHLERFGSEENVYRAKSELAQAIPSEGLLVCNGDNPGARRMAQEHRKGTTLLYGFDESQGHLDCVAKEISFTPKGTTFTIHWQGRTYPGYTPLLGRPALSNVLGAFTLACALGAKPEYLMACLANLQPVENRLVLDRGKEVSFLRDAYNSNPTGFEAALDVLATLPATRRILITPGMIELGDRQFDENRKIATLAARVVDLFIVVGPVNREALVQGCREADGAHVQVITVDTREDGFKVLKDQQQKGDLILVENDLGDLHEGRVRF